MKTTVKKILLTLSAVLLFAVVLCFNASALEPTGKCGDNVTWSFDSETGTLTISGTGDMADYYDNSPFKYKYEIDNVIIENGVTSIGKSVFSDCINIESVTIGKDVTTIEDEAFGFCSNIKEVYISDLSAWCNISFEGYCSNPLSSKDYFDDAGESDGTDLYLNGTLVTDLVIPSDITSVSESLFFDCASIESVTIHDNVSSVGSYAFSNCKNLKKITVLSNSLDISSLPSDAIIWCYKNSAAHTYCVESGRLFVLVDGTDEENKPSGTLGRFTWSFDKRTLVLSINGSGALPDFGTAAAPWSEYEDVIGNIVISKGITNISSIKFCNYNKLKTVILPEDMRSIPDSLFNGCESLTTITIPDSVEIIGEYAFYECKSHKNVTIGKRVGDIGEHAFRVCVSLESLRIPDNVRTIRYYAFSRCSALSEVTIGKGVETILNSVFEGCKAIEKVYITDLSAWCKIDYADTNTGKYEASNPLHNGAQLYLNGELVKNLVIPEDINRVKQYAFTGCSSIETVTFHKDIFEIEQYSFGDCENIKSVIFGDGLISIGSDAFFGCKSIESMTIPRNARSISLPGTLKEVFVYSKECKPYGLNYTNTIYGFKGSEAEKYADEIAANFIDIETVHTTHEYVKTENRDYCSYEICFCGAEKGTLHTNKDNDTICDSCNKSVNHIDVGEKIELMYMAKTMLKYTAVETGTYKFEVINQAYAETSIYDENKKELDGANYEEISRRLEKGETVYWCIDSVDDYPCKIVCTLSVEHEHSYEKTETKKPTCTSKGEKTYTCSCGDTYKEDISKTAHTEESIKGKAATCTKKGLTDGKKCTACGKVTVEQKELPALGHKETTVKAVKPTYTKTGLTEGKKCKVCGKVTVKQKKVAKKKLKKVTISSVKSTKKATALVTWKKVTDASGYIVEYSTSKKFTKKTTKKVTIKKGKTTKTTLKKLKSGKKYYVRIKAYKTVNKKTVYGAYSSVKSVKIK